MLDRICTPNNRSAREQGFTLVEILIVIVIMGILAGIVVLAVGGLTDSAAKTGCVHEAEVVRTAVSAYKAANNTSANPTWLNLTTGSGPLDASSVKFRDLVNPPGIGKWFYDASTGTVVKESTKCT